jgi:hypothetical protein
MNIEPNLLLLCIYASSLHQPLFGAEHKNYICHDQEHFRFILLHLAFTKYFRLKSCSFFPYGALCSP